MTSIVDGLRAEAGGQPYLAEAAYEAFWAVALENGADPAQHVDFDTMPEGARWAWHAAGMAALRHAHE